MQIPKYFSALSGLISLLVCRQLDALIIDKLAVRGRPGNGDADAKILVFFVCGILAGPEMSLRLRSQAMAKFAPLAMAMPRYQATARSGKIQKDTLKIMILFGP